MLEIVIFQPVKFKSHQYYKLLYGYLFDVYQKKKKVKEIVESVNRVLEEMGLNENYYFTGKIWVDGNSNYIKAKIEIWGVIKELSNG